MICVEVCLVLELVKMCWHLWRCGLSCMCMIYVEVWLKLHMCMIYVEVWLKLYYLFVEKGVIFVAKQKYDAIGNRSNRVLSFEKGEELEVFGPNSSNEWWEVRKILGDIT